MTALDARIVELARLIVEHADRPQKALAYSQKDAAELLGVSVNYFKRYIRPEIPAVYVGSLVRFRHTDLESWLDSQ